MKRIIALIACTVCLLSCTENERAKNFGGTVQIELTPNTKLVNVTWKDKEMWILTRAAQQGEKPLTYNFDEKSNFGMIEGHVVFQEH